MNLVYEITHEKSWMLSLVNQISHVVVEAVVVGSGGDATIQQDYMTSRLGFIGENTMLNDYSTKLYNDTTRWKLLDVILFPDER